MDLIRSRRSTRRFDPRPVSRDDLAAMAEAARWAPSACNDQPWRFVAVTDPVLRGTLVRECLGPPVPNRWASAAPAFLVCCARRGLVPHRLAEPIAGITYHHIDLGIAMEHAVLRAQELGLGTCYIGWFKGKKLARLLKLPGSWKPLCLLAVGHPAQESPPQDRLPLDKILFFDRPPGEDAAGAPICGPEAGGGREDV